MGDVGTGAAAKLALNQLIASLTHGYSLALRLVQASGLEVERFMEVLRPSASTRQRWIRSWSGC